MPGGETPEGGRSYALLLSLIPVFCVALLAVSGVLLAEQPKKLHLEFLAGRGVADVSGSFTEPSGLSISSIGGFWSVSDSAKQIFRLDDAGTLISADQLAAFDDLEGIAEDSPRDRLIAVREDTSELIVFRSGETKRVSLVTLQNAEQLSDHFPEGENNGLEGLTVEPASGTVLVIKERAPRLLIEISPDLAKVVRVVELSAARGFVSADGPNENLDVSGLSWDAKRDGLWIVSDTGRAVFFFDVGEMHATGWSLLERNEGKVAPVENAEGVALSADADRLFIVTDDGKNSRFLSYRISRTSEASSGALKSDDIKGEGK